MGVRIRMRRDTAANWTSNDTTLEAGEIGWESDTNKIKIGDGATAWTSLAYFSGVAAGDEWGDAVDANIIPDTDGTYDLGSSPLRFNATYTDSLDVTNNITVGGTVDGRDIATDGTKLDGIEASADVTDETNVTDALDGATLSSATVATGDKVLIQDIDDSDVLKTVTAQSIADLTATLTQEEVEDFAGALVATGGTKTGITVTYQDATGDMDFVVDTADLTTAGIVELATVAETNTGTDATRAVTPDGLDGWTGSVQVTTLGTIATGTWEGTTVAVDQGGTGQTSYTDGQLLIGNSTGNTLAKATLTGGTSITVTNGSGTISLAVDDDFLSNTGDVGTGTYDFGGADDFEIPNGAAPTVDTAGQIAVDTTITDHTGLITYHDGTEALYAIAIPTGNLTTTDGHVVAYNATNNEFEMVAQSGAGGSPGGSDTQVQFNDSSSFGGDAGLTYNKTTNVLTVHSNIEVTEAVNDGNPEIRIGSADAEELHIQSVYDSGAQTLDYVLFQTDVASATADKGLFRFNVDGTDILDIDDGGLELTGSITVSGTVDGRDIATDGTKLDGIEASADVTDEANVTSSLDGATLTAITVAGTDKVLLQDADDSDNLKTATAQSIADLASDTQLTQEEVEDFAGALVATGGTKTGITITYQDATGDMDFVVDTADLTTAGIVELATVAETNTGTDATRAVTPDGLDGWTGSAQVVTVGALNSGSITSGFGAIDNGTSNITTGGIIKLDVDGTAENAAGSLTMGAGDDAGIFFDGTDLVIITNGAGASGIILDSEDDTVEIKGSGTLQATFDTGGLNLVSGDTYEINGTSVLSATTLGTGVTASSLTSVGTLTALQVDNINVNGNAITSTDTNGNITLTPDGTGNVVLGNYTFDADQTVGAGQDNYVLTYDNGTGLISLEAASGGATLDYELISSATASNSATIEFTSLSSTYMKYVLVFDNLQVATDTALLWIRVSTDNGCTFKSGASDYRWINIFSREDQTANTLTDSDSADSEIQVGDTHTWGTADGEEGSGEITIYNPATSTARTHVRADFSYVTSAGQLVGGSVLGIYDANTAVDAIQILASTGNLTTGNFRLYGVRAS